MDLITERFFLWVFRTWTVVTFAPGMFYALNLYLCLCLLENPQKKLIQIYFEPVTVDSVEVFRHFEFLATVFIALKNCTFLGASVKLINNRQLWIPTSYKFFMEPPYTIVKL